MATSLKREHEWPTAIIFAQGHRSEHLLTPRPQKSRTQPQHEAARMSPLQNSRGRVL